MTTPSRPDPCPECGKPVPAESQHQVCPSCLLAQAFASRTILPEAAECTTTPPPTPEEIADKFPQFEITECLGRGGMGVVYKARQKSLNRWVAIKILPPERIGEEKFAERFAREAQTLAQLNHPNIVTVFDYGKTDHLFYIVMEYVDGVNLRDLLRDGKLEAKQALAIVPPVCEALQYAHNKGIVHRDIKPENLLLDREGRIKIADFGIASLIGAGGEIIGTPPYMAPEQASGKVDHRADIYSLGVVLYELLTGELPGTTLQPPSRGVHVDVRLDEIVLRALESKPELRYQTAGEFRTRVETMSRPAIAAAPAPEPPPLSEKRRKRRKKVIFRLADGTPSRAALLVIALLCILGGALVMIIGEPVWQQLTHTRGAIAPFDTASAVPSALGRGPQWIPIAIGTGIAVLLGALVFSMITVARGSGSGVGKGLAIGCLGLVFGGVIVVIALGTLMVSFQPDLPAHLLSPAGSMPRNYAHPTVGPVIPLDSFGFSPLMLLACGVPVIILLGVLAFRWLRQPQPVAGETTPTPTKTGRWKMIALILLGLSITAFLLRGGGRYHPLSSLNSGFNGPVIGRIEFKFSHPDALSGGNGVSFDVKKGGDTRWVPWTGSTLPLIKGQSLTIRSRVDATGKGQPTAMVTTTKQGEDPETGENRESDEETRELHLHTIPWVDSMTFSNGLRVTVTWTPASS